MSVIVRKPQAVVLSEAERAFAADVLEGLAAEPKQLPPKYFYDQRGSELFEQITMLREYYPTRTEIGILEAHAGAIAQLIPRDAAVVEFGAGSTDKFGDVPFGGEHSAEKKQIGGAHGLGIGSGRLWRRRKLDAQLPKSIFSGWWLPSDRQASSSCGGAP